MVDELLRGVAVRSVGFFGGGEGAGSLAYLVVEFGVWFGKVGGVGEVLGILGGGEGDRVLGKLVCGVLGVVHDEGVVVAAEDGADELEEVGCGVGAGLVWVSHGSGFLGFGLVEGAGGVALRWWVGV
jgi:hypothetical protein